jgi:hypothetical protein
MNGTPSLFAECPLPGCINPVDDPRWPCGECEAALAGYIRPPAQLVTVEEATAMLADRDKAVAAIYAEHRTMVPLPELAEVTPTAGPGPQAQPPTAGSGSCGTRCQPGVQAKPALLDLRGTPHLPTGHGPPRPLDMQDVRGDHMTRPRPRPRFRLT